MFKIGQELCEIFVMSLCLFGLSKVRLRDYFDGSQNEYVLCVNGYESVVGWHAHEFVLFAVSGFAIAPGGTVVERCDLAPFGVRESKFTCRSSVVCGLYSAARCSIAVAGSSIVYGTSFKLALSAEAVDTALLSWGWLCNAFRNGGGF